MSFKNQNKLKVIYATCFVFIILSNATFAEDHYILAGAKGDGSSWSQPLGALPSILVRGDTYFVADGTYDPYVFDDPELKDQYIYITKATTNNHGTDVGWNNDMGDGQAVFNLTTGDVLWRFLTGYYKINGLIGTSFSNWDEPCGFVLTSSTGAYDGDTLIYLGTNYLNDSPSNITFQNIELTFPQEAEPSSDSVVCYGIYSMKTSPYFSEGYGAKQITISNCFFNHIQKPIKASYGSDWLLEESYFKDNWSNPVGSNQGEAWEEFGSDRCIVRNNYFENIIGSGVLAFKGNFCSVVSDWEITGNIFYWSGTTGNGIGDAVVVYTNNCNPGVESDNRVGGFRIYNNSFYSSGSAFNYAGIVGFYDADKTGNPSYFYNNIMYDCRGNIGARIWGIEVDATGSPINSSGDRDYNTWISCGTIYQGTDNHDTIVSIEEDPFVDAANKIFTLKKSSTPGYNNATILQYDKDGFDATRGEDGIWDRGAIEYTDSDFTEQTYTLNISISGNGSVILDPDQSLYTAGQSVTLLADPAPENTFIGWTGDYTESSPKVTITMNSDMSIISNFDVLITQIENNTLPESAINWKLIENMGEQASDYSGQNGLSHALLVNNPSWTSGNGLLFNGASSYLETPDSDLVKITESITFSTWIKLNSYTSWGKVLVKPHSSFASPWEMYTLDLGSSGNTPRFVVTDGIENGTAVVASSAQTIGTDQWYHIAGTYDGSEIRLYLNGQLQSTQTVDFAIGTNAMPLCIGGRLGMNTINGNISDVRIYDECLTSEQIDSLYNCKRNDALIKSLAILDKSTSDFNSTFVRDSSGYNQDATIIASAQWGQSYKFGQEDWLSFNGSNQAVEVSMDAMLPEAGSIAMLVEPSSDSGPQFLFGHVQDNTNLIWLYTISGQLTLGLGDNSTLATDIAPLTPGQIYHIALTWNNNSYNVYIDGTQVATGSYSGLNALNPTADIANMGTEEYRNQGLGFDGIIDDVQLYSRSLSANEIEKLSLTHQVRENKELSFDLYGEDLSGNPYTYTAANLPAGAVFDTVAQQFIWRPWYNQAGEYQIQFTSETGTDQQTLTVSTQDIILNDWYREFLEQQGKL